VYIVVCVTYYPYVEMQDGRSGLRYGREMDSVSAWSWIKAHPLWTLVIVLVAFSLIEVPFVFLGSGSGGLDVGPISPDSGIGSGGLKVGPITTDPAPPITTSPGP
jgi:hypothetical protein